MFASEMPKLQYISRVRDTVPSNHIIKTVTSITVPQINMGTLLHVGLEAGEQCE